MAEWLRAVIQGFAERIEILWRRCGERRGEEAPSLLHSADNFNVWPRIVLSQPVLWKHAAAIFPPNTFPYFCFVLARLFLKKKKESQLLKKPIDGARVQLLRQLH